MAKLYQVKLRAHKGSVKSRLVSGFVVGEGISAVKAAKFASEAFQKTISEPGFQVKVEQCKVVKFDFFIRYEKG